MDSQTLELFFKIGNAVIMPFWLIHVIAPYSKPSLFLARWKVGALVPAVLYSILVLPVFPSLVGDLADPQLSIIAPLLGQPFGATVGWLHFLAFDLYVAENYLSQPESQRVNSWIVRVALFFTLMIGPFGFLVFWGAQAVRYGLQRGRA